MTNTITKTETAQRRNFYCASLDILVYFRGDDFTIVGNEELVSDETLFALHTGNLPAGWAPAPCF